VDPPQPPPETGAPLGGTRSKGGKDADGGRLRRDPAGTSRRHEHPGGRPEVPPFQAEGAAGSGGTGEPEPRPYVRTRAPSPRLGPFHEVINEILAADEQAPPKQRHTAMQVHRRLVSEHGYRGGYDAVRRYIGKRRRKERPTFIRQTRFPAAPQPVVSSASGSA